MDWSTLFTAIGAILSAAGGCVILIREFRRRDRRVMKREMEDLNQELAELRANLIVARRYTFHLVEMMTEKGLRIPYPQDWEQVEQAAFERGVLEKQAEERKVEG